MVNRGGRGRQLPVLLLYSVGSCLLAISVACGVPRLSTVLSVLCQFVVFRSFAVLCFCLCVGTTIVTGVCASICLVGRFMARVCVYSSFLGGFLAVTVFGFFVMNCVMLRCPAVFCSRPRLFGCPIFLRFCLVSARRLGRRRRPRLRP